MDTDPDQHSPMSTDQDPTTDTDQCRVAMDTVHRPATTIDTDQGPVTAMDTDQGPTTTMDPDQSRFDQRPVTDAPPGRYPIRQTMMRLSCRGDCPRLLLVNDDQ